MGLEAVRSPGSLLNPSREELLAVAVPAITRAFERHMSKRKNSDWEIVSFLIAEKAGIDDADELWTPKGAKGPLILPDDSIDGAYPIAGDPVWIEEGRQLSIVAQSANLLDGLTENNLPHYTRLIYQSLGKDGGLAPWMNRWTAEEYRHSLWFDYYLLLTQWANPKYVERVRKAQIATGEVPEYDAPDELFIYTTAQELSTRISHRNHATHVPAGLTKKMLSKISAEEEDHFRVYFDGGLAVRLAFPDRFLLSFRKVFNNFQMPGTGIEGFAQHSRVLNEAGVYDYIDVYNVFKVLADQWDILSIEPTSPVALEAKQEILYRLERLYRLGSKLEARRESLRASGQPTIVTNPFPGYEEQEIEIPTPRAKRLGEFIVFTYSD